MVDLVKLVKDNRIELNIRYAEDRDEWIIRMIRYPLKIERHISRGTILQSSEEKIIDLTLQDMLTQLDREEFVFKHGGQKCQ